MPVTEELTLAESVADTLADPVALTVPVVITDNDKVADVDAVYAALVDRVEDEDKVEDADIEPVLHNVDIAEKDSI